MEDYDNLDTYNGDVEHDMWVDFDRYEYTGEGAENFDASDLDEFIDNLDDWE